MRQKLVVTFGLLCAVAQAAWAQTWTEVSTKEALNSAIADGALIRLTDDITLSAYLKIGRNASNEAVAQTVTIDLNGHTLSRSLSSADGNGHVIEVFGQGNLTLTSGVAGGTITGGWANNGGGICNYGTLTIENNVTITGCKVNTTDGRGGAIYNGDGSSLTIDGAIITGNTAHNGGGIFNDESSAGATLSNCTISNNTATGSGGGIFNDNANSDGTGKAATMTMTGCIVTGNSCTGNGGGIRNIGNLTINGATITGNSVSEGDSDGAGIYHRGTALNMQGAVNVSSNTKNTDMPSNLYISVGHIITVTGSLTGSSIGLGMTGHNGTATSGLSGNGDLTCFANDYPVATNLSLENGEATLTVRTDQVYYVDRWWSNEQNKVISEIETVTDYIELTGTDEEQELTLEGGKFYVVKGSDVRYLRLIAPEGDPSAKLILCDGAKLTAQITIEKVYKEYLNSYIDEKLDIYGQASDTGELVAEGLPSEGRWTSELWMSAGIGAWSGMRSMGVLNIHGGNITADASKIVAQDEDNQWSAGIGGGGLLSDTEIFPSNGGEVTIYGGTVTAKGGERGAGIGAGSNAEYYTQKLYGADGGTLKVYGGNVTADGGYSAAGIGGSFGEQRAGNGGHFEIWGGTVTAIGGADGAGIGGGFCGDGGTVIVHGGTVIADSRSRGAGIGGGSCGNGGDVTVWGGTVRADGGKGAAGIGSGRQQKAKLHGGTLTVHGGYVYADGTGDGCGIGGGMDAKGATVVIDGGIVEAWCGSGDGTCAIGSTLSGTENYGSLTFGDNMMVHAGKSPSDYSSTPFTSDLRVSACWYRDYARIEPCDHQGATYIVNGTGIDGTHTLQCPHCLSGGTEEQHTFDGGTCTVCGVGQSTSTVSVYMPEKNGNTYGYGSDPRWTVELVTGSSFELPAPKAQYVPAGVTFAGWRIGSPTELGLADPGGAENELGLHPAGESYTVNGNTSLTARFARLSISVADNADNTEILGLNNGKTAYHVTFADRTLYKDGAWNTLCLPFDVDIAGSPLDGAEVRTLSTASFDNTTGTLTLNFTPASGDGAVTMIEAGKPYIIKWTKPSGYDGHEGDYDLTENNLVFSSKTISDATHDVVITLDDTEGQEMSIAFRGIFSPLNISDVGDNTKLYLGTGNTLYYPSKVRTIKSCRAYFQLYGLTAGESAPESDNGGGSLVRAFNLNFGDGDATGIVSTTNFTNSAGAGWYDLSGRRLQGMPTAKGIYVHNGRKVVMK